jgi:hypothetical protein
MSKETSERCGEMLTMQNCFFIRWSKCAKPRRFLDTQLIRIDKIHRSNSEM